MPPEPLPDSSNLAACFTMTLKTLDILAHSLNTPFLGVICATAQSVLENMEVNILGKANITVNLSWVIIAEC